MKTKPIDTDLLMFDLDGTLADSRKDIVKAVNFTLTKIGLGEKTAGEILSYVGTGAEDLIRKTLKDESRNLFKKAFDIFSEYYKKHSADQTRLFPGVEEILDFFSQKRKVIVTNRGYDSAVNLLKTLGIHDLFEKITGGDDIGCLKPDSCPLDNLISNFNVKREKAIIIGDMNIDILAGKKAGIWTCAVTYGIGKKEDIERVEPDFIIDDIMELKGIIR